MVANPWFLGGTEQLCYGLRLIRCALSGPACWSRAGKAQVYFGDKSSHRTKCDSCLAFVGPS
eukprot:6135206-Alexandrium_andersonii.AAC.1